MTRGDDYDDKDTNTNTNKSLECFEGSKKLTKLHFSHKIRILMIFNYEASPTASIQHTLETQTHLLRTKHYFIKLPIGQLFPKSDMGQE